MTVCVCAYVRARARECVCVLGVCALGYPDRYIGQSERPVHYCVHAIQICIPIVIVI